jgi:hypothetical protein
MVPTDIRHTFAQKNFDMKNTSLAAIAALFAFAFSACDRDPYLLDLQTFDVRWYDVDKSGTQTANDELTFFVRINSTAPDSDEQFVREWEFTYSVNGKYGGLLRGDDRVRTNSLTFDAEIAIANLKLPNGQAPLGKGDVVEFVVWARDNHGTELERAHRYIIEE